MSTIIIEEKASIPGWVVDLESFRRWARSKEFPRHGWFSHIRGKLWADVSMEKVAHNLIKGEYSRVLDSLAKKLKLGRFFFDRMLLTNLEAELSTEPDGMFVSWRALRDGRVVLEEGEEETEVQGSPDMTLEVISRFSVRKDTKVLREAYWQAGIRECWLVDSRGERATFSLLRYTNKGYAAVRAQSGWLKSAVFSRFFRLVQRTNELGYTEYILETR
jgi:Uma2 family endonuclease